MLKSTRIVVVTFKQFSEKECNKVGITRVTVVTETLMFANGIGFQEVWILQVGTSILTITKKFLVECLNILCGLHRHGKRPNSCTLNSVVYSIFGKSWHVTNWNVRNCWTKILVFRDRILVWGKLGEKDYFILIRPTPKCLTKYNQK